MPADRQIRGWLAQLADLRMAALCRGGQRWIGQDPFVKSVPDLDASPQGERKSASIAVRDAAAGGGRADEEHRRSACQRVLHARHHGHVLADADAFGRVPPRPRRVDDGDDLERRVPQHSDRRLRGGRRELALGEDRDLHRPPRSRP